MNATALALRGLVFYRRTHVAAAIGVACAVAVLAGALLVGGSVRASLGAIAASRLGRADVVVAAEHPFGDGLGVLLASGETTPMLTLEGVVQHESSSRRARGVRVYGVDQRFFAFHHVSANPPSGSEVWLSPDLSAEMRAAPGDVVLVRVTRPTDIPIDSLQGKKEDAGRSLRLRFRGTLDRDSMGEFSLAPTQGPARAVFVALSALQRDLDQPGRVNTVLVANAQGVTGAAAVRTALRSSLTVDDLGVRLTVDQAARTIVVESTAGLIPDVVAKAAEAAAAAESLEVTPVLTWLANRMTVKGRSIPYSLVTAIGPDAGGDARLGGLLRRADDIVLNDWAARDLQAAPGDSLELEFYRWTDEGHLATERAPFHVAGIVPMDGLAADRRLAPDYPGISNTNSLSDWNPPFPINLKLVRPADEDYWRRFRTTPKAFVTLTVGQSLWRTRHGQLTSLRVRSTAATADLERVADRVRTALARAVDPFAAGFTLVDTRAQSAAASAGATDFGVYFASFSIFLMISALLLSALFFRLGIEQRLAQIGVLRAMGYSLTTVRRLFLIEGAFVAVAGSAIGVALALGWAALMMHGLRTWWVGAVGTTRLQLHIDPIALGAGAAGGLLAAAASIAITIRALGRSSPRQLLSGDREAFVGRAGRASMWIAVSALTAAALLAGLSGTTLVPPATGFFGAGTLVLLAGLTALNDLGGRFTKNVKRPPRSFFLRLVGLGVRNASWRPGRSLTSAGLVAAAVFLIVSVDAFRQDASGSGGAKSGTGGFALIAEATVPIARDMSTADGRAAVGLTTGLDDRDLQDVDLVAARLRPGDDTSCLNLYRPSRPRVLGVPDRFIDASRFRFGASVAATDADRQNPWRLLRAPASDDAVPAIADATSLEYVLHAAVGDVITIDAETARPVRLRIVAALDQSMLQGELVIADAAFLRLFPDIAGYRVLLIDVGPPTPQRLDQIARVLEDRLAPFGLDVEESGRRLEAYHRVENTYLSTFQALGGLGLLLGTFGIAAVIARNVLERRRELALLGAAGFTGRHLQVVVLAEHLALVGAGLIIGVAAAGVAVVPVLITRHSGVPRLPLAWLVVVALAATISALWNTRTLRRLPLVPSLRSE